MAPTPGIRICARLQKTCMGNEHMMRSRTRRELPTCRDGGPVHLREPKEPSLKSELVNAKSRYLRLNYG